jgi:hypothetical protein
MEEFVNFELAMKLKEKGFKEECLAYYDVIDNVGLLYNTQYTTDLSPCQYTDLLQSHNTDIAAYQSDDSEYCVDAPTIPQVLEWLRKKDIMVEIIPSLVDDGTWTFSFRIQTKKFYDRSTKDYTSYEQAALAGIEHSINNLI